MALLGSLAIPSGGLGVILRHAFAVIIADAKVKLCIDTAGIGSGLKQTECANIFLRHTVTATAEEVFSLADQRAIL